MKKIIKIFMMSIVGCCLLFGAGCASTAFEPETTGVTTGKILYVTYVKVAEGQDAEFKEKVSALWKVVNAITSEDDLQISYDNLDAQFKAILDSSDKLSDSDKQILVSIANDILNKVKDVIQNNFTDNDGIEFLLGVRDGLNSMIPTESQN